MDRNPGEGLDEVYAQLTHLQTMSDQSNGLALSDNLLNAVFYFTLTPKALVLKLILLSFQFND